MKISKNLLKFQAGGPMPAEDPAMAGGAPAPEAAPAEAEAQNEMMTQIGQMAQQIISQLGPEPAMMLAQAIMEMVQGGTAGGEELPPAEEQPVYSRQGGRLVRIK